MSGASEQPSWSMSMMLWGSLSADTANAVVLSLLGGVGEGGVHRSNSVSRPGLGGVIARGGHNIAAWLV
jgi:hypothetical protein